MNQHPVNINMEVCHVSNLEIRVRCLVDKPENNGHIVCGSTGTVVYCEGNIVFVEWDNYVDGHDCDGHASEWGYGWNVLFSDVELEGVMSNMNLTKAFKSIMGF